MCKINRIQEYYTLFYRILLAYIFYFIARVLFFANNSDLIVLDSASEFFRLSFYGLAFDTSAIMYVNSLFILLSILPLTINTAKYFQRILFYVYFPTNLIAYATNYGDFIYYKFIFGRTTGAILGSLENETNKLRLLISFLTDYWYVFLLFFMAATLWIYAYKKVILKPQTITNKKNYFITSTIAFLIFITLCIGGIRGGFNYSTRPINMVSANRHVKNPIHADIVLNTPFSIIRTAGKNHYKKVNFVSDSIIKKNFKTIKQYSDSISLNKPNVIIFIIESYGREYLGSFNKRSEIENYETFTPFIDSLAQHSLIFSNAFANGRKSRHAISSILAGIPSFKIAFTSSSYVKQPIQSVVSVYKKMGYDTSFFYGASNGSMSFLGFCNILGFDHYYGKTEFDYKYPNNSEYDDIWGIWDAPFLQYMNKTLRDKKQPFMSTVFTLTSHSPFKIPKELEGKFPIGHIPMHQCVGYTDYAIKSFFEAAKKESWFNNTLFVFTADHTSQIHYDKYKKVINRASVPIMFYYPKENSLLVGERTELAQQIDIYPTILQLSGYKKPFRSWGRSLIGDKNIEPFVITHSGILYEFIQGNYICTFDGEKVVGFYAIDDKGLENNLIQQKNKEMIAVEEACKAFIQDYMNRILDRNLTVNPK